MSETATLKGFQYGGIGDHRGGQFKTGKQNACGITNWEKCCEASDWMLMWVSDADKARGANI